MSDNYQRERYNKTMKEMAKLKCTETAGEVFEKHYQGVYEKDKRGVENREASDIVFDLKLNKYKTESNREITRDLKERVKYYNKLDEGCEDQLEKDAELSRKRNNEILRIKQQREKEIQEKKDKEKEEKRLELQKEELTEQQRVADMKAESNMRVAIRQRKTEKAKSKAEILGDIYKRHKQVERDEIERKKTAKKGVAWEKKERRRRKADDSKILTKKELNEKYPFFL